ncbi:MAG: hypothetical protein R3C61_17660 [Bacteroidia bacterium]
MRTFCAVIAVIVLMAGCVFDDDLRFVPQTGSVFLHTGERNVIKITDTGATAEWKLAGAWEKVDDISGTQKTLWLAEGSTRQIWEYNPVEEQIVRSRETGTLSPHFIAAGDKVVAVCDTSEHLLGFFRQKDQVFTVVDPGFVPGRLAYRNGKFYIVADQKNVAVYDEQAYAQIGFVAFSHQIVSVEADARSRIFVHTREGSNSWQGMIEYNTNSIGIEEQPVGYKKIRYTPYVEKPLGKEYIRDIQLVNGRLNIEGTPECTDFEADFFESNVYLVQRDTLFSFEIATGKQAAILPFTGNFLKGWYFIEQIP